MNQKIEQKELFFSITKKDLIITWFSGTGAGGQYRNKHQNCCRIEHPESRAIGTGQSQRDRPSNIKEALNSLVNHPRFKIWHSRKICELTIGKSIDNLVEEAMKVTLNVKGG